MYVGGNAHSSGFRLFFFYIFVLGRLLDEIGAVMILMMYKIFDIIKIDLLFDGSVMNRNEPVISKYCGRKSKG